MAEISDEQLAVLTRAMTFLQEAASKPETRRDFERLAKKLRPEVETTDDIAAEVAKPYVEQIEAVNSKIDDFLKAQADREAKAAETAADRARDEAFSRLRQAGYTDEGMDTIKKLMIDRAIADPEAAAALFDKMNPKVVAESGGSWEPDAWNFQEPVEGIDVKALFSDPDRWADKAVYDVLRAERSGGGN